MVHREKARFESDGFLGFLGVACSDFFALSDYSATGHLLTLTRRRNDSSDIEIMFGSIRFLLGTNLLDNCCLCFSYHRLLILRVCRSL